MDTFYAVFRNGRGIEKFIKENLWYEHDMVRQIVSGKYTEYFGFFMYKLHRLKDINWINI